MEVGVRVEAENVQTGEVRHTSTAYLTMVAVNDEGGPISVPPLDIGEDPDARQREAEAQLRRKNRLAEREAILAGREKDL